MKIHDIYSHRRYVAADGRYDTMLYRRCGQSGIRLPAISFGLWHNFGHNDDLEKARQMLRRAFDMGITHFDLANNYGPPYGAAEENFGRIFRDDFKTYRDELIISSKAGWDMWPGPYGNLGSKKYMMASLDQSLLRMGLDYVDIFYHHRPDPDTPLEESMEALALAVLQGKALYVGVSQYPAELVRKASEILANWNIRLLIHQPRYSMMDRWVEKDLLNCLEEKGIGAIAFSPLEQGVLSNKYLNGFPEDSRAVRDGRYLSTDKLNDSLIEKVRALNNVATKRGQSLAQMAVAWLLKDSRVTSVLVGASRVEQLEQNVAALSNIVFEIDELAAIEKILAS